MSQEFVSIEEAISRSLPIHDSKVLKKYLRKHPGRYSVPLSCSMPALGTNPPFLLDDLKEENPAILRVDMDEWINVYGQLLDDPSQVEKYVGMLPNRMAELVKGSDYFPTLSRRYRPGRVKVNEVDIQRAWICTLFGVSDHADIWWETEEGRKDSFKRYLKKQMLNHFHKEGDLYVLNGTGNQSCDALTLFPPSFEDGGICFSSFFLPVTTVDHKKVFSGIKGLVDIFKESPEIQKLTLVPGDCSCFLLCYRRPG